MTGETGPTSELPGSSRDHIVAEIGVIALIGLVVALIGPFGTDEMPLTSRFAYWIGGFLLGWAAFRLIALLTNATARLLGWPSWVGLALAVPLLAVPSMVAVSWGTGANGSLFLYAQVAGVGAAFYALFAWVYGRDIARRNGEEAKPDTDGVQHPNPDGGIEGSALHADLPPGFSPIIALAVEDHYVTVHSADGGREMLLVNLADAIERVGAENGVRTHRSWWVAACAVTGSKRDGRNWKLTLMSGIEAPVSRANVPAARAAGWLR